jgi:hypothetical protein
MVAKSDRCERWEGTEVGLGHMGSHNGEKKYRYETKSGLEICLSGVASHNGSIRRPL